MKDWMTLRERLTMNLNPGNERRWAYYRYLKELLEALTLEDREWLAQHGLDVADEIMGCEVELMTAASWVM